MKKFLIETKNNEVVDDFSFTLIQSIKYQNWYHNNDIMSYVLKNNPNTLANTFYPVGSVEFVHSYLEQHFHNIPKPLNIPEYFCPLCRKKCSFCNGYSFLSHNSKYQPWDFFLLSSRFHGYPHPQDIYDCIFHTLYMHLYW